MDREWTNTRRKLLCVNSRDVEQGVEQLVHGGDRCFCPFDDAFQARGITRRAQLANEHSERMQRLAQIVTRHRKKACLGKIGLLQLFGALCDLALEVGIGCLKSRRHGVELLPELLQLVARADRNAMAEVALLKLGRAGVQGLDRRKKQPREMQGYPQRREEADGQQDEGTP